MSPPTHSGTLLVSLPPALASASMRADSEGDMVHRREHSEGVMVHRLEQDVYENAGRQYIVDGGGGGGGGDTERGGQTRKHIPPGEHMCQHIPPRAHV